MEHAIPANLAAYCAQVTGLALLASPLPWLLRVHEPAVRYMFWRLLLMSAVALPWVQPWQVPAPLGLAVAVRTEPGVIAAAPTAPVAVETGWGVVVALLVLLGIGARAIWLIAGLHRLSALRRLGEPSSPGEYDDLQHVIGARADVRYTHATHQPVTFGLRRPCVLLPATLRVQPAAVRRAVVAHELWHVRRRDWAWMLFEEGARAVLWFQPAVWWIVSRIRLAREEVVDRLAIAATGERDAYLKALVAFSNSSPAAATAFARRQHLFRRILLISQEETMTAPRVVCSGVLMLTVALAGGWSVMRTFPLTAAAATAGWYGVPGPMEREAARVSPGAAAPRLMGDQPTIYPADAVAAQMSARVTVRAVVDADGVVGEARVVGVELASAVSRAAVQGDDFGASLEQFLQRATFHTEPGASPIPSDALRAIVEAFARSALRSVRGYRYEAPAAAPLAFDVTVHFAGRPSTAGTLQHSPTADGALRVGRTIQAPRKVHHVPPVYPAGARAAGVEGVVILEVRVEGDGRVSQARVLRSIPELDQAAIEAVGQWRFQPTLLNGAPAPVVMVVTIQFKAPATP